MELRKLDCSLFVFVLVSLVVSFGESIKLNVPSDFVRCYCNLPSCITSSYMCKSYKGGCFSQFLDQANEITGIKGYNGLHGCADLLSTRNQRMCIDVARNQSSSKERKLLSKGIVCCDSDMCNHVDNPQLAQGINKVAFALGERMESFSSSSNFSSKLETPIQADSSEVWFRAAIIAVPICGAIILLVLVVLAVNLLKWESSSKSSFQKFKSPENGMWSLERPQNFNSDRHHYHNNIIKSKAGQSAIIEVVYGDESNTFLKTHPVEYAREVQNCFNFDDDNTFKVEKEKDFQTCEKINNKPHANLNYEYCSNVKRVVAKYEDLSWCVDKNLHQQNDVPKLYSKETLS